MAKTVLFLATNPQDTPSLRCDKEIREITHALARARNREDFVLTHQLAARAEDVRRAMMDHRPHIVHFCGHGAGEEGLAFEDADEDAKPVSTATLARFFELFSGHLECVVLNACYSEVQAEAIARHVPYVIGMKEAIDDSAAASFAVAFYDALFAGHSIEFAFKLAYNAIEWEGGADFPTPVLLSRPALAPALAPAPPTAKSPPSPLVTNLEYLAFVRGSGHRRPGHWRPAAPFFPAAEGDAPVTWVSWEDAEAYCDWMGGRLPDAADVKPLAGDRVEVSEWLDAGDGRRRTAWDPGRSSLHAVDAGAPRKDVGFRCVPVRPARDAQWAVLAGGRFTLGTDVPQFRHLAERHRLAQALRRPILQRRARSHKVSGFQIAVTAVTNDEYYRFTQARGQRWPSHWEATWLARSGRPFPVRLAARPVVNVRAEDAQAYCIWSRARLPHWFEWELAAAGGERRPYPWGSDYRPDCCNSAESGRGSPVAVDEYPLGDTPDGVRQLCGNVAEWVAAPDGRFEIRGGSYRVPCELWGLSYAFRETEPGFAAPEVGFRVIVD